MKKTIEVEKIEVEAGKVVEDGSAAFLCGHCFEVCRVPAAQRACLVDQARAVIVCEVCRAIDAAAGDEIARVAALACIEAGAGHLECAVLCCAGDKWQAEYSARLRRALAAFEK